MLEIKNISASYGRKKVIENVSVSFEKGCISSVIGLNGCGKTTLLKSIAGIIPLKRDTVFSDGEDLSLLSSKKKAKKLSYLAQEKKADNLTVREIVLCGRFPHLKYPERYREEDKEIAAGAIAKMGLSDVSSLPYQTLSGGTKQKVFIAMALCQNSDYILLDEPTTHLDIASMTDLSQTLKLLADEGKGIIAVLHDIPLAMKISQSVAVMKDGKILIKDSPEKIYESGIIDEVFSSKLKRIEDEDGVSYYF